MAKFNITCPWCPEPHQDFERIEEAINHVGYECLRCHSVVVMNNGEGYADNVGFKVERHTTNGALLRLECHRDPNNPNHIDYAYLVDNENKILYKEHWEWLRETVDAFYQTCKDRDIFAMNAWRVATGEPIEYVYIIEAGPYYKIGRTANISTRLSQLAILLPFPFELHSVITAPDAIATERELHQRFAGKRTNGEWFLLDNDDLRYIIDHYLRQGGQP